MSLKIVPAKPEKNALAAALAAVLALAVVLGVPARASAGAEPPLRGVFKDNFSLLDSAVPAPQAAFSDAAGRELSLADFKGRVVLLNFWATWCAPCVREMPTLDRVQGLLGEQGLAVLVVSEDRRGLEVVAPFFKKLGLEHLEIYLDPRGSFAREFSLAGLPTTFLIDAEGRLVGGLEGPAEWDSEDAQALIRYYLDRAPGAERTIKTSG